MARQVTGEAEVIERLAEAGAQVMTLGLNHMPPTVRRAVRDALAEGAVVRLIVDFSEPLAVTWLLVKPSGVAQRLATKRWRLDQSERV